MNLTKCFVAGLCLTAMTAAAVEIKANAFETLADKQQSGWWVGADKSLQSDGIVVDGDASLNGYLGVRPMTGVTSNQVLKLDTEGGVWTNTVNQPFAGEGNPVEIYADMLVKFVPSEELPDEATLSGKLAIAVKADGNGTNRLNITWNDGNGFATWSEIATKEVSTSLWHRVTVKMYTKDEGVTPWATVYLNNDEVLDQQINGQTLYSIGFQGTGFIDEVVVRDDNPISTGTFLILSFSTGIESVFVGETQKNSGDTVLSGSDLIIKAAQWKEIADVTGPSTVTWVTGAAGASAATVTVANATATTVTITAQTETSSTGTSGTGTSFDGAPMNKVATWALANGVTALTSGIYDQYLFNIDDTATVPTLRITSVSISGSDVTVTVTADGTNFTSINGTLKLKSYATLGATPTVHTITFSGTTTATITQNIGTDKFVKAAVE